jgi:hypothetical protein
MHISTPHWEEKTECLNSTNQGVYFKVTVDEKIAGTCIKGDSTLWALKGIENYDSTLWTLNGIEIYNRTQTTKGDLSQLK